MEISFIYESNHFASSQDENVCAEFEVFVLIESSSNETNLRYEIVGVFNSHNESVPLDSFPRSEELEIRQRASERALDMWLREITHEDN